MSIHQSLGFHQVKKIRITENLHVNPESKRDFYARDIVLIGEDDDETLICLYGPYGAGEIDIEIEEPEPTSQFSNCDVCDKRPGTHKTTVYGIETVVCDECAMSPNHR